MVLVCVDGVVGCGKSSALRRLAQAGVRTFQEPVGDEALGTEGAWDEGLRQQYAGVPGSAFVFQNLVVDTRVFEPSIEAAALDPDAFAVMERSPAMQELTFVKMGAFSDEQRAALRGRYAAARWSPLALIYMRASPAVSFERASRRGRSCERSLPFDFHERLHAMHEDAVKRLGQQGVRVTTVDTDGKTEQQAFEAVLRAYNELVPPEHRRVA